MSDRMEQGRYRLAILTLAVAAGFFVWVSR